MATMPFSMSPARSRIVTVAGNVAQPRNYEVLIGTPMDHLVRLAGPRADTDRYIMGGTSKAGMRTPIIGPPMM